jgi:hypothetical protein
VAAVSGQHANGRGEKRRPTQPERTRASKRLGGGESATREEGNGGEGKAWGRGKEFGKHKSMDSSPRKVGNAPSPQKKGVHIHVRLPNPLHLASPFPTQGLRAFTVVVPHVHR